MPNRLGVWIRARKMKSNALRFRRLIVAIKIRWSAVGGHQYVQVTIAVEISASQTPANFQGLKSSTHCIRCVLKFSAASIHEEMRRLSVSGVPADIPNRFVDVAIGHRQVQSSI